MARPSKGRQRTRRKNKRGWFRGNGRPRTLPAGPTKSRPVSPVHCAWFFSIVRYFSTSLLTSNIYALPYLECVSHSFKIVTLLNQYPGIGLPWTNQFMYKFKTENTFSVFRHYPIPPPISYLPFSPFNTFYWLSLGIDDLHEIVWFHTQGKCFLGLFSFELQAHLLKLDLHRWV